MTDITIWQLAIDGALVASLLYMCFSFGRSSSGSSVDLGQLRQLESSLRRLMKEGERASETLGSELGKRQNDLEQLLFDLQTAESRVEKTIDEASALRKQIRSLASRVETEPVQEAPRETVQPQSEPIAQQPAQQDAYVYNTIPEPPSFENVAPRQQSQPAPQSTQPVQQSSQSAVNIYGEPIEATESSPLRNSIEREVTDESMTVQQSLEELYGAADEMLRAGQSFEQVSRSTSLPLDEVKMLSQIISREEAVQGDPVRRGTQVL